METITYTEPTHRADESGFRYSGRWHRGFPAVTINSGAMLEFVFAGASCDLLFDTAGMTMYPDLLVQVDEGAITRHHLETSAVIRLCSEPAADQAGWHLVRCWTIIPSVDFSQWSTLNGGCKFLGVRCASPEMALPALPAPSPAIEFLGDSITASLRLYYTGHDWWDDHVAGVEGDWRTCPTQQSPVRNWTWHTARLLGMHPIVTGFGGQGLTTTSSTGAPPAADAFPFIYADTPWNPPAQPRVVVIYHGTNDPEFTEEQYYHYLRLIRRTYPAADIFAVCPYLKTNFAPLIHRATQRAGDHVHFADYSSGIFTPADTVDGIHLNPSGALRLAVQLAGDIARVIG